MTYKYPLKSATMPLLEAACDWHQRTYGTAERLDPAAQALCLVGSQEGLAHLLMAVAEAALIFMGMRAAAGPRVSSSSPCGLQSINQSINQSIINQYYY